MDDPDKPASAFGCVLMDARGRVLLRQPTNKYGGYAWTFAKGPLKDGETPAECALRHVQEETGWQAEILAEIPGLFSGTTSASKFFLAGRIKQVGGLDAHTAETRWADFNEASDLIRQSPSRVGQERDLALLRAAQREFEALPFSRRPATCSTDWQIHPLPDRRTEFLAGFEYDDVEMASIRKGFLPIDMDEKWFIWFADDVLYLHRSWTGICVFEVRFEQADSGWRATSITVNRDEEQYGGTDDDDDHALVYDMIASHLLRDTFDHFQG